MNPTPALTFSSANKFPIRIPEFFRPEFCLEYPNGRVMGLLFLDCVLSTQHQYHIQDALPKMLMGTPFPIYKGFTGDRAAGKAFALPVIGSELSLSTM